MTAPVPGPAECVVALVEDNGVFDQVLSGRSDDQGPVLLSMGFFQLARRFINAFSPEIACIHQGDAVVFDEQQTGMVCAAGNDDAVESGVSQFRREIASARRITPMASQG